MLKTRQIQEPWS